MMIEITQEWVENTVRQECEKFAQELTEKLRMHGVLCNVIDFFDVEFVADWAATTCVLPQPRPRKARRQKVTEAVKALTEESRRKARAILLSDLAKIDDIAWALAILEIIKGGGIVSHDPRVNEGRLNLIREKRKELDRLKMDTRNDSGVPVDEYRGVNISGMDRRERTYILVQTAKRVARELGYKWPILRKTAAD